MSKPSMYIQNTVITANGSGEFTAEGMVDESFRMICPFRRPRDIEARLSKMFKDLQLYMGESIIAAPKMTSDRLWYGQRIARVLLTSEHAWAGEAWGPRDRYHMPDERGIAKQFLDKYGDAEPEVDMKAWEAKKAIMLKQVDKKWFKGRSRPPVH